jgi:hypothetical protein
MLDVDTRGLRSLQTVEEKAEARNPQDGLRLISPAHLRCAQMGDPPPAGEGWSQPTVPIHSLSTSVQINPRGVEPRP